MAKFNYAQTSFAAGRFSPKLTGRIDLKDYYNALSVSKNALLSTTGAKKRGALEVIKPFVDSQLSDGEEVKRIHSVTNLYGTFYLAIVESTISEFTPFVIYVLDSNYSYVSTQPISVGLPVGATPSTYSADDLDFVGYEEFAVITHRSGDIPPHLIGIGPNPSNAYETYLNSWYTRPLSDVNKDAGHTLTLTNVNNPASMTIQSNVAMFSADWVGEILHITNSVLNATGDEQTNSSYFSIDSFISPTEVNVSASHQWASTGVSTIANYGATGSSAPSSEWRQSVWSNRLGWPTVAGVYQGRLWLGATFQKPATVWASKIGDPIFFNQVRLYNASDYSGDIVDTDPMTFTVAGADDSYITGIDSSRTLAIRTNRSEYVVSGGNAALSPRNISIETVSSFGSSYLSANVEYGSMFVDYTRTRIVYFGDSKDTTSIVDVSVLSEDLFEDDLIAELAWSQKYRTLFILTESGKVVPLYNNLQTKTWGFSDPLEYPYAIQSISTDSADGGLLLGYQSNILKMSDDSYKEHYVVHDDTPFQAKTYITGRVGPGTFIFSFFSGISTGDVIRFDSSTVGVPIVNTGAPYAFDRIEGTNIPVDQDFYAFLIDGSIGFANTLADAENQISAFNVVWTNWPTLPSWYSSGTESFTAEITPRTDVIDLSMYEEGDTIYLRLVESGIETVSQITLAAPDYPLYPIDTTLYDSIETYAGFVDFEIATMPIEAGSQLGTAQRSLKRIDNIAVRYYNTISFETSSDGSSWEDSYVGDDVTGDPTNGRKEVAFTASSEYDQVVHIRNNKDEPCEIVGLIMKGLANDG